MLVIVGAVIAVVFLLPVVAIAGVTLLGRSSSSKFASVAPPVTDPVTTAPATTLPTEWTSWSPPDGSLTIQVPDPNGMQALALGGTLPAGVVSSPSFQTNPAAANGFLLMWVELDPNYTFDNQKGLKGMAEGAATHNGGTLLSSQPGTFAGMDSIAFTFEKHGISGRGFGFVAGKRLYALAGFGPDASTDAVFQKYVDSLHLK